MKDRLPKVRRKHVDWKKAIDDLQIPHLTAAYLAFRSSHPLMSVNRCAYNVLKKYYSTTAMLKYRMCGVFDEVPDLRCYNELL